MLKGINKLLTGDLLKVLSDMGHGDEIVIADANFPASTCAKRLVHLPGIDGVSTLSAILEVFELDTYSEPVAIMDLTDEDKKSGSEPAIWDEYKRVLNTEPKKVERFAFYERAKKAYAVVLTGEERTYANLILVKGVIK